jgi:hypothetical protein
VGYGTGKTVEPPNNYNIKFPAVCVGQQLIQFRALFLTAGNTNVYVLLD